MKIITKKKLLEKIFYQLEETNELLQNLVDDSNESQKLNWIVLTQDNDIRKLKDKNKEYKEKIKELKSELNKK